MEEDKKIEEVKNDNLKQKNGLGIKIIIVALFIIGLGIGLIISNSMNSNSENKESGSNKGNNENTGNVEIDNPVPPVVNANINSLYNNFHTSNKTIELSKSTIESIIYEKDVFYANELSEYIPHLYSNHIIEATISEITSDTSNLEFSNDEEFEKAIYDNIEKVFNEILGENVTYSKKLFENCYTFSFETTGYTYSCVDTTEVKKKASFNIINTAEDSNNAYIYEEVSIVDENSNETKYVYKLTFDLQKNGNYYFFKAERMAKENIESDIASIIENDSNNSSEETVVSKLIEKYHSDGNLTGLIEEQIYTREKFEIQDMGKVPPAAYGQKIMDKVVERLNNENSSAKASDEQIKNIVKEEYSKFFGKRVEPNDEMIFDSSKEITGCWTVEFNNGKYEASLNCGSASTLNAESTITKNETDEGNNYIYVYEDVIITDASLTSQQPQKYTYKWTFELQEDGNYYFLRAERVNN